MAVMVSDSKGKLSSSFKDAGESSSKRMARSSFPPGFRFHPTDVELIQYYLKRKVMKKKLNYKVISEIQLYNFAPWDLPEKSCLQTGDLEWYFFCPRDKKYGSGSRTNRATDIGYWKTTGKDRSIQYGSRTVGVKKTLIFHVGKSPHGSRTDWVMHEYMLKDKKLADASVVQDTYVLCKLFEKSGSGPKNGEQHGAPFVEEEWEDDPSIEMMDSLSSAQLAEQLTFADPSENAAHGSMSHQLPDHIETFLSNLLHDDESGPAHLQGGTCEDFCPSINERMPAHDGSDLFLHIGDLSYQEPLQLDGFDADRMLEELLLGISGEPQMEVIRSYMEPSDLVSPMEGNDYMYVPPANIGSHPFAVGPNENEDVAAFPLDHGATTAYVNDEFGGSSGWQYEAESLSSSVFQNPEQQILWPLHLAECSLNNPSTVTPGFSSSVPT